MLQETNPYLKESAMKNLNLCAAAAAAMMILQAVPAAAGEAALEVPDLRGKLQYTIEQRASETVRADIEAKTGLAAPGPVADTRFAAASADCACDAAVTRPLPHWQAL